MNRFYSIGLAMLTFGALSFMSAMLMICGPYVADRVPVIQAAGCTGIVLGLIGAAVIGYSERAEK